MKISHTFIKIFCVFSVIYIGMLELFKLYIESSKNDVPYYIYEGLMSVFCVVGVVLLICKGKDAWRDISFMLFCELVVLIYSATVIFRMENVTRKYNFMPFWSYDKPELLVENIMNIVVFVPIGILLGYSFRNITWWKALFIGASISASIEISQFCLMRGFSELDDVIHNTIGCMIGYGIYSMARVVYEKLSKTSVGV